MDLRRFRFSRFTIEVLNRKHLLFSPLSKSEIEIADRGGSLKP